MTIDAERFGKHVAAVIKAQLAPLKAANEKLAAENAALVARLVAVEAEQKAFAGQIAVATFKGAVIDRRGSLIVTFGDGSTKDVGIVVGRDADGAAIAAQVTSDVIKAIPRPRDGTSPTAEDLRHVIVPLVEAAVKQLPPAQPSASETVDALRSLIAETVRKAVGEIPRAKDGVSPTAEDLRHVIAPLVEAAVKQMPPAQPGQSVTIDDLRPVVVEAVQKAVAEIPRAKDGVSPTAEDLRHVIAPLVEAEVKRLPPAQPGKDADPEAVRTMIEDTVEKRVAQIQIPGPHPGVGAALVDQDGELVVTRTDGVILKAGNVRGTDGVSIEDLTLTTDDGGRTFAVRLTAKGRDIERRIKTAIVIDRGVWRPGAYDAGDAVTLKGSWWVASRETQERPGDDKSGWRLAVKRGRDGRGAEQRGRAA
jgi:hypothetical protein